MGKHGPSFPFILGTRQTRPCNSDDSREDPLREKIARELRCLKASMLAFHGRPDDTESTTSTGT